MKASTIAKLLFGFMVLMIILSAIGCKTTKSTTSETLTRTVKDSLVYREKIKFDTVKISAQTASAAIPFKLLKDSLLTDFQKTVGRATVSYKYMHDTLYLEANCDSAEKVIANLNTELTNLKNQQSEHEKVKETVVSYPGIFWIKLLCWLNVLLVIMAILFIISKIKSWLKVPLPL